MKCDRRNLKWRARDAMRAASPNVIWMTFLYLLLTAGVRLVVNYFAANPLGEVWNLFGQGLPPERAIPLAVAGVGSIGLFINVLIAVFGVVLDFGYRYWCLKTARGEAGETGDLIEGFAMVGRILWLRVLILVYGFLWYLVIFMPALLGVIAGTLLPVIGPIVSTAVFAVAFAAWLTRVIRYSMAIYCLADEPEMGASFALRRSCRMMRGAVGAYILLRLSFVGWYLLNTVVVVAAETVVVLLMGGAHLLMGMNPEMLELISGSVVMTVVIALASWPIDLWLRPYETVSECAFYDQIRVVEESVPF